MGIRTSCDDHFTTILCLWSNVRRVSNITECSLDAAKDPAHGRACILHVVLLFFTISLLFQRRFELEDPVKPARRVCIYGIRR